MDPIYANRGRSIILVSAWTNGERTPEFISFIRMIVNTFWANEKLDFLRRRLMNSKLGC
jgi:hypothetical protein